VILSRHFTQSVLCEVPRRSCLSVPSLTRIPQHPAAIPVSPLAATLMDLPASVANKRLTAKLNPLDATLTENTEGTSFQPNAFPSSGPAPQTLRHSADFLPRVFNRLRTLPSYVSCKSFACHSYENCRVYTKDSHSGTREASPPDACPHLWKRSTICYPHIEENTRHGHR
jgi:hypothetical protein